MIGKGKIFIFPNSDENYWSPTTLYSMVVEARSPNFKQSGHKSHYLTIHLQLLKTLRMSEAVASIMHTLSLHIAYLTIRKVTVTTH